MTIRYRDSAIVIVSAVVCALGSCWQEATVCPGGLICPVGNECAAEQAVCVPAGGCGNGRLDGGEQCDDGNIIGGDGCSASCRVELVAGGAHTCVLRDGDRARCWGLGSSGQLGVGMAFNIGDDEPGLVEGVYVGGPVEQLFTGGSHNCALLASGSVRCWGANGSGQLGYGYRDTVGDDEVPFSAGDVDVGGEVEQLALGSGHTCALLATGKVRCWGNSYYGQLGYGNVNNIGDDEPLSAVGDVDVGGPVKQLVAGRSHNCALLTAGKVRCWGYGNYGQLGYGNDEDIGDDEMPSSAGDVEVTHETDDTEVVQLAAGWNHTCALLATGKVRCWGRANDGQLGYGNVNPVGRYLPPYWTGDVEVGGTVIQLTAGESHTCALLATGAIRCWGRGGYGRLGYGNTESIGRTNTNLPVSAGDVHVGGPVEQVVAGGSHTCALLQQSGDVRCWGDAQYHQLGYGTTEPIGDDESPSALDPIAIGGPVKQLAIGGGHTCALLTSGTIRCWGDGEYGQPGYGSRYSVSEPDLFPFYRNGGLLQLAAGERHTCALSSAGGVYCWGDNSEGQLGQGVRSDAGLSIGLFGGDDQPNRARSVQLGSAARQIAAGAYHACALLASGAVRCWGRGERGQLGYGARANVGDNERPDTAGDIELGGVAVQIVAGDSHTCVLLASGAVRCFGANDHGQLGLGSIPESSIGDDELPVAVGEVPIAGPVVQLAAGGWHTCALLEDRSVSCWGAGADGQLGHASTESIGDDEPASAAGAVSIDAPAGTSVVQLAAGDYHTCALLSTGAVRCWGRGDDGQLGHSNTDAIGDDEHPHAAAYVDLGGRAIAIAAGSAHTCAMLDVDTYRCWGRGADGRLGYGHTETIGDDEAPVSAGEVPSGQEGRK